MPPPLRPFAAAVGATLVLAAAGCGSSAQPTGATTNAATGRSSVVVGQGVVVTGNSALRFVPMTVRVHVGKVRVTLVDDGAYPHNIQVPSLGYTSPTVTGSPGETRKTFTIDFPHAGRYAFRCQYHFTAGMVGTFVAS